MLGKLSVVALIALVAVGCGASSDSDTHIGDAGQKGIVVRDIDQSKSVAKEASQRTRDGDQALGN